MRRNNNYLVHAKGKGKKYDGEFITVNGRKNNSPEYNHNYYFFNKEKWQNIYNKAKSAVKSLNQNDITKGTAKGSGGMPTNVRNKYTNTEIAKAKVRSTFNAAGRSVNSAREQARLTFNNAGAAVERARQAAKGYGAKIRYKVGSAAKEAGRRMGNAAYRLNPNSNRITKGTAKGSGGMPSNVRNKYTNTEIAKSKVKSVGRRAGQLYDEAGRRINAAKDTAVNTYNDVRREAGRRLHNAAYQLNPNANDVTRGRNAAGMPSNVRSKYTNTENLKRGAKGALNAAGKRVNAAKDAAVDAFNDVRREAGRRLNNAKYYANPNANKTTRGLNAAGMPSDVRSRHTNTENLKRGAKNAINNAGKQFNSARDAAGRILKEAGRQAGNAAYRLNPNGNDVTRGRTAAGMPSDVRSKYTNTENLKRGVKSTINKAGKQINEVAGAPGRAIDDAKNKISKRVNDALTAAGQTAAKAMIAEVKKEISSGTPTNEIEGYSTARKILKDIGFNPRQIAKELGLLGGANGAGGTAKKNGFKDHSENTYDPYANMPASNKAKAQQMDSFVKDVQDELRRTGMNINDFLKSQSFDLTLAEFGGYDPDKLSADEKRILGAQLIKKLRK